MQVTNICVHPYYQIDKGTPAKSDSTMDKTKDNSLKIFSSENKDDCCFKGEVTFPEDSPIKNEEGIFVRKDGKCYLHGKGVRHMKNGLNHVGVFRWGIQIEGRPTLTVDPNLFYRSSL